MLIVLGVEVSYSMEASVLPRVHTAVVRECNRRTMEQHARDHIPKHFEPGAGSRYGYEQRRSTINLATLYRENRAAWDQVTKIKGVERRNANGTYAKRSVQNRGYYAQVKKVLGLQPLVWSGQLRKSVDESIQDPKSVTATPKGARLNLRAPAWATSRIRRQNGEPMKQGQMEALKRRSELQAITPGELRTLRAIYRANYLDVMNDPTNPRHTFLSGHATILRTRKRFGKG